MCVCVCTCVCMYACMCVCLSLSLSLSMYIYIYIYISKHIYILGMCICMDFTVDMLSRRTCPKSSLGPPGSSWEGVSWRFWFWLWVFVLYGGFCNNWFIDIVLTSNLQFSLCSEIILRTVHVANSDLCVRCIYKSVFVPYGACYNMWYVLCLCWNKSQN